MSVKKNNRVVAIPAVSIFVYFEKLASEIAKPVADAIDKYVNFVEFDNIKHYSNNTGYWRNLTQTRYGRDLAILKDYPQDLLGHVMEYNSRNDGVPGTYGLYAFISDKRRETAPLRANYLRFDFDSLIIDSNDGTKFVDFYIDLLQALPFQSSHAGYSFKRIKATEKKATPGVNKKINRYFGFDPCYEPVKNKMIGYVFTPHWLNAINSSLEKKIGGFEKINKKLSTTKSIQIGNGLIMQGAQLPPVGDINRGASDIGSIPEIARLLKPLRTTINALGEPYDAQSWLARYDDLDNRPWK